MKKGAYLPQDCRADVAHEADVARGTSADATRHRGHVAGPRMTHARRMWRGHVAGGHAGPRKRP